MDTPGKRTAKRSCPTRVGDAMAGSEHIVDGQLRCGQSYGAGLPTVIHSLPFSLAVETVDPNYPTGGPKAIRWEQVSWVTEGIAKDMDATVRVSTSTPPLILKAGHRPWNSYECCDMRGWVDVHTPHLAHQALVRWPGVQSSPTLLSPWPFLKGCHENPVDDRNSQGSAILQYL